MRDPRSPSIARQMAFPRQLPLAHPLVLGGRFLLLALVVALVAAGPASPPLSAQQAQSGIVRGTVTSVEGLPVQGAQITVQGTNLGALTDARGSYRIDNVPPGLHTIRARSIGLRPATQQVEVPPAGTATADFTMEVDALDMEELVVTGTRTPQVKLTSSIAITTLNREQIEQREPRSTADLLKAVPGFYVESSGGEVGGNLWARGLPADGSFRYVALMEDGMPVFDATELSFVNADIFVRVDENIDRVEGLRGGTAALFGSNAPGGVINFINKTGGPELAGVLQAKVATDGYTRYDVNVNGPLAEDWRFNVGGFYRYDDGIRDPDFATSRGGMLKANVTRLLEDGYVRLYAKYLNDRNTFFLPLPFQGEFDDEGNPLDIDFIPGFPDDGILASREGVNLRVPLPRNNGDLIMPLDDGQRQNGGWITGDLSLDVGDGWGLRNTLRFMSVDHTWNAMVPSVLSTPDDYAAEFLAQTPGAASFQLLCTNVTDGSGDPAPWGSQACPRPNDLVHLEGLWRVDVPMTDVSNQFQLTKSLSTEAVEHTVTLGTYFGHYTADNAWYFNNILTEVADRPHFLDLVILDDGGEVIQRVTERGFRRYLDLYVNGRTNATIAAVYAGDEVQFAEDWRLNVGARFEYNDFEVDTENTEPFDLGGPTLADDAVNFGNGTFRRVNIDFEEWAATVGLNYSLTPNAAVYVRGSRGYKMPILSNYLFTTDPADPSFFDDAEQLWQAEGGLRYGSPRLGLSAVGYVLFIQNFPSQDVRIVDGQTTFVSDQVGEARTFGLELEAVAEPVSDLRFNLVGTLQRPEYTDFVEAEEDLSGNRVRRIPQVFFDLTGAYTYERFQVRGNWNFFGHRFSDAANTVDLPEYSEFGAGASYDFGTISVAADVLNITGADGLTEGNPRLDESRPAGSNIFLARPILPRRFQLTVSKEFF